MTRWVTAVVVAASLLVSCADDGRSPSDAEGTLVFGVDEPTTLDPQLGDWRVSMHVFETLVRLEAGTSRPGPGLATSWSTDDGQTWTFQLRRNVRFHDGTSFDAGAVCANLDRWYHLPGPLQPLAYWRLGFDAYATLPDGSPSPPGRYRSCEARGPEVAVISLHKPVGNLPSLLAIPAFGVASPAALRRYDADKVTATPAGPRFEGTFGTQHPIGTGPFRFVEWARNEKVTLGRNDDYWDEPAKLDRLIFRFIAGPARQQALETGEIAGYSGVAHADRAALRRAGFQIVEGPAVNAGMLVLNRALPPLDNPAVRQAVALAVNRETVVKALYPSGTETGTQLLPPAVEGHTADAAVGHDPERARRSLQASGVDDPTLHFTWPSGAAGTEPLVPDPEAIFLSFKADLEGVGFSVEGRSIALPEYVEAVQAGRLPMFFFPLYSARGEAEDFLRAFKPRSYLPGVEDARIGTLVDQAVAEVDAEKRGALYAQANRDVSELSLVVPIAHVKPATALRPGVSGLRLDRAGYPLLQGVAVR